VKVTDIYPGLLRTGELGTLLISGKNLQHIQYVELRAVSAPKPTGPSTTSVSTSSSEKPIKIKPIDPTKLIVEADLSNIQVAGAYLLSLGSGTDDDHPGIQVVVPINVLGAGQLATSANQSTPVTQGPFASCLTSSPSMLPSSGSQANTGVNCSSSVLTDHEVLDNFGGHVSNVYYAIQVRVSNQNSQYDFLLRDILITLPDGRVVSGRIKRLAQGVVLKGRSEDRRAIAYNVIGAAGTIYGGAVVLPVTATLKNIGN
jgi:hypothetical protein